MSTAAGALAAESASAPGREAATTAAPTVGSSGTVGAFGSNRPRQALEAGPNL